MKKMLIAGAMVLVAFGVAAAANGEPLEGWPVWLVQFIVGGGLAYLFGLLPLETKLKTVLSYAVAVGLSVLAGFVFLHWTWNEFFVHMPTLIAWVTFIQQVLIRGMAKSAALKGRATALADAYLKDMERYAETWTKALEAKKGQG